MGNIISSKSNPATQNLIAAIDKALVGQHIELEAIETAIKAGADVNARTNAGFTLIEQLLLKLDDAAFIPLLTCLIRHKARLPRKIYEHMHKLPVEVFKLMLEQGLNVTTSAQQSVPLIYQLIEDKQIQHIQALLDFYPEFINYESMQVDSDVPMPDYEEVPAELPAPSYYCSQLGEDYACLNLLLARGAELAPNIISHSLEALGNTMEPKAKLDFFKFWISLFLYADRSKDLLEELETPRVKAVFATIAKEFSLTCIGLDQSLGQSLSQKLAPAQFKIIDLKDLVHYNTIRIDKTGVHFQLNTSMWNFPEQFNLSLIDLRLVLDKHPQSLALGYRLTDSMVVEDHPIVKEFFTYYQKWLEKQPKPYRQELNQLIPSIPILSKLKKCFNEKLLFIETPELREFIKAPATVSQLLDLDHFHTYYDEVPLWLNIISRTMNIYQYQSPTSLEEILRLLGPFTEFIPMLVEIYNWPLDLTDSEGNNFLHLVVNPRAVKYLLDRGMEFETPNNKGYTPLYKAHIYEGIAKTGLLLNQGAKVDLDIFEKSVLSKDAIQSSSWIKYFSTWVQHFMFKKNIDALATTLTEPRIKAQVHEILSRLSKSNYKARHPIIGINLSASAYAKLQAELPKPIYFFNLSLQHLLTYEISAITEEGIQFTYPAYLNKQGILTKGNGIEKFELESFELSLIIFKLLLQQYVQHPLAQNLKEQLKNATHVEKSPVVDEFLTIYEDILARTLFQQQANTTTLQHSIAKMGLFKNDIRIMTQDEPEPTPNPNYRPD